jgi:hypothetical protein
VNFDAFAIAILLLLWASEGVAPWLVLAALRHGQEALSVLPLSIAGGILGGLLVPLLGFRDAAGLLLSMPIALLGGLLFTLGGIYWRRSAQTRLH